MDAKVIYRPESKDLLNLLALLLNRCDASDAWTQSQIDQIAYELAQSETSGALEALLECLFRKGSSADLLTAAAAYGDSDFPRALRFLDAVRARTSRLAVLSDRIRILTLVAKVQSILLHGVSEEGSDPQDADSPEPPRMGACILPGDMGSTRVH